MICDEPSEKPVHRLGQQLLSSMAPRKGSGALGSGAWSRGCVGPGRRWATRRRCGLLELGELLLRRRVAGVDGDRVLQQRDRCRRGLVRQRRHRVVVVGLALLLGAELNRRRRRRPPGRGEQRARDDSGDQHRNGDAAADQRLAGSASSLGVRLRPARRLAGFERLGVQRGHAAVGGVLDGDSRGERECLQAAICTVEQRREDGVAYGERRGCRAAAPRRASDRSSRRRWRRAPPPRAMRPGKSHSSCVPAPNCSSSSGTASRSSRIDDDRIGLEHPAELRERPCDLRAQVSGRLGPVVEAVVDEDDLAEPDAGEAHQGRQRLARRLGDRQLGGQSHQAAVLVDAQARAR